MNIEKVIVVDLDKKEDERGYFSELIQAKYVPVQNAFGLVYISQAKNPGVTKGNHFHLRKTEWFCVIKGTAELYLKKTNGSEIMKVVMGEDNLKMVKVPPGIIHAFRNIGPGEMILLAYISEMFDPDDPDTVYKKII
jgi:UDP-2-acetamido-2,6-beta-L-arabino-hexul-4-ose reductase